MKPFLALSRTTHGVLDIAAPAFCALLWLGDFPSLGIILLSLVAAFSAYTATYALNDLVGIRADRLKFAEAGINPGYSVEASAQRYPLAQGLLSYRSGLTWTVVWFALAMVSSYLLNPIIVLILVLAIALEVLYCQLHCVTYWRVVVSGLVKASGPLAAVFVVDFNPSPALLLLLFSWLFLWEIGGQNIPADWNDTVEDRRVEAKTIPLQFGFKTAGLIVLVALSLTVIVSCLLPLISPTDLGLPYILASLLIGFILLIRPAYQLYKVQQGSLAARLFDRASYYPLSQLALITLFIVLQHIL